MSGVFIRTLPDPDPDPEGPYSEDVQGQFSNTTQGDGTHDVTPLILI